jgi:prophage regulatory protein
MEMTKDNGPEPPRTTAPPLASDGEDHAPTEPRRMLNEKQVLALIPIARSTLWRMERKGQFPKGTYILPGRKLWYADEVAAFQIALDGQSRGRRTRRKA